MSRTSKCCCVGFGVQVLQSIFLLAAVVLVSAASAADEQNVESWIPQVQLRAADIENDRLNVLVETFEMGAQAATRKTFVRNCLGYLLTAQLSNLDSFVAKHEIIGPLWEIPGPDSYAAVVTGDSFDDFDFDALPDPMRLRSYLGANGVLTRLGPRHSPKGPYVYRLDETSGAFHWRFSEKQMPHELFYLRSFPNVQSLSRRFVAGITDRRPVIVDTSNCEIAVVPWLERSLLDIVAREDLKSSELLLDDELKSLVVVPLSVYRDSRGVEQSRFSLRGSSFERGDYVVVYSDDKNSPHVFPRPTGDVTDGPFQLLRNEGQLLARFVELGKSRCFLTSFYGTKKWTLALDARLVDAPTPEVRWSPASREMTLLGPASNVEQRDGESRPTRVSGVDLVRWNIASGKCSKYFCSYSDTFRVIDDRMVPLKTPRRVVADVARPQGFLVPRDPPSK